MNDVEIYTMCLKASRAIANRLHEWDVDKTMEIAAESWIECHEAARNKPFSYVWTVVRRKWIREWEHRDQQARLDARYTCRKAVGPEQLDTLLSNEIDNLIECAIGKVHNPAHRIILERLHFGELDNEICQSMGLTHKQIHNAKHRAIKAVKMVVKKEM